MVLPSTPNEVLQAGISAWSEDVAELSGTPVFQTEVIPLICLWGIYVTRYPHGDHTSRRFISDILAHEQAVETVGSRLQAGQDSGWRMLDIPCISPSIYRTGRLAKQTLQVIEDGAPRDEILITSSEAVLAEIVAHALYNSSDGVPMISRKPFGAAPSNPQAWKQLKYERVIDFTEALA